MANTMTDWEKEWMSEAPQDCLRTFVLNPTAPGGYSEYGETMLDFETTETLTEDNGQAKISLLKVDAPSPLQSGTFLRTYLFGSITDGVPVWQTEANGEPKNYRNYYVRTSNSRWFERHLTGHVDRYKHDYICEEVLACLKDYPIRSVKTFAEGAYTFKECLAIAFQLAFRPRSVGDYRVDIKDFPGLDEPNSKLEYVNATLYDVVTDIGRIIDAVPSMEITFQNGVYTFELRYIDRYGLEGDVHDISYFNMKLNDATNTERDSSAGASISFVNNLLVGNSDRYPKVNGMLPAETNAERSWEYFELPYPIDEVSEVDVYWRYEIKQASGSACMVYMYSGESYPAVVGPDSFGGIMFTDALKITREGYTDRNLSSEMSRLPERQKTLYLREYDEYKYLPSSGSNMQPTKSNSIYYTRGDNKVYLSALFNDTYRYWYSWEIKVSSQEGSAYATFTPNPGNPGNIMDKKQNNKFYVAVKFSVMLNGCIKGANSKPSDLTVFFNQQGQVVDIKSFGTAVNNYTKTMFGENRVLAHTYNKIGRKEMYEEMPRVGSSVIDKERGKRYVVTDLSFTRRMNGGLLLATLAESRAGKSRYIIADNRQKCYAIPSEQVVDSMSHTHIICKMGVKAPFEQISTKPNENIYHNYLFNALTGNGNPNGVMKPTRANLKITLKNGDTKSVSMPVFNSRFRLSALTSFRMQGNSLAKIKDGEPILYTDDSGQLESIEFQYYRSSGAAQIRFSQAFKKDAYEILNHTTQVSWVEYGNLQIGDAMVDMSYFGDDNPTEQLQLVLLSSRMRLKDSLSGRVAARYNLRCMDQVELGFGAGELRCQVLDENVTFPTHVGWAIARGDTVILLDNFDTITDNVFNIYYQIEVRD